MRTHLCSYCGYNTTSQSNLRIHLRQHTKEKPFVCESCDYQTADHNSLRRHRMKHTGEKRYKCPHCPYASIQSSTYKVIYNKIALCFHKSLLKRVYLSSLFQAHLRSKHPGLSDELIFACQLCNFRTIRKEQLNLHVTSNHESIVEMSEHADTIDGIRTLSHSTPNEM